MRHRNFDVYMQLFCLHATLMSTCNFDVYMQLFCLHATLMSTCNFDVYMQLCCLHATLLSACNFDVCMQLFCLHATLLSTCKVLHKRSLFFLFSISTFAPTAKCRTWSTCGSFFFPLQLAVIASVMYAKGFCYVAMHYLAFCLCMG